MKRYSKRSSPKTIGEVLLSKSNDYSHLERKFRSAIGQELLQKKRFFPSNQKIALSVVIPSYNSNEALEEVLRVIRRQVLNDNFVDFECVVVDDGSEVACKGIVSKYRNRFPIKYFRLDENRGAGYARWLGTKEATHEAILYLDSDVVLSDHLLLNHAFVHAVLSANIIFVSFREKVKASDPRLRGERLAVEAVDISDDFRVRTVIKPEWTSDEALVGKKVSVLSSTNYFKNFGDGRRVGIWDLPMMGLTTAYSAKKSHISSSGYRPSIFKGWGFEDIALTAALLSRGGFLIPNLNSAVLHVEHAPRSGSLSEKRADFERNKKVYQKFLESPVLV